MRLGAALLVFVMSTTASAQQFATVTTNAPIYAAAQETPTPVRVAAVGSRLRVISTQSDWVQVEYNDPLVGRRVGWVLRHYISLTSQDLRPMDLSVPEAQPAPAAPEQPTAVPPAPATSIPFPRWETSLGWSFLHVSGEFLDLNSAVGWNVSVAGNVSPWLGIVGDATGNYKSRIHVSNEPDMSDSHVHRRAEVQRAHVRPWPCRSPSSWWASPAPSLDIDGVGDGSTEFTIQPGGGVDIGNERVAARLSFAWRRVFYEGNPTNMVRFVGGVVIRR